MKKLILSTALVVGIIAFIVSRQPPHEPASAFASTDGNCWAKGCIMLGKEHLEDYTCEHGNKYKVTLPEKIFNDLLDAICMVESECKADAEGDNLYFNTWNDANSFRAGAYEYIHIDFGGMVFDENSVALVLEDIRTTPDGAIKIYLPQAIGAYQLHKIYVDDVNRIIGEDRYIYADRWDPVKSREMATIYVQHYTNVISSFEFWRQIDQLEAMARIHNSGPDGWRNDLHWFVQFRGYTLEEAKQKITNSMDFWAKVKAELYK